MIWSRPLNEKALHYFIFPWKTTLTTVEIIIQVNLKEKNTNSGKPFCLWMPLSVKSESQICRCLHGKYYGNFNFKNSWDASDFLFYNRSISNSFLVFELHLITRLRLHTYHSRFIPEWVAEVSQSLSIVCLFFSYF
jgi:hypothetical protein